MDDGFQVQPLGGDQRKALREIEAHLVAEDRDGPRAGTVGFAGALVEDAAQKVMIGLHVGSLSGAHSISSGRPAPLPCQTFPRKVRANPEEL